MKIIHLGAKYGPVGRNVLRTGPWSCDRRCANPKASFFASADKTSFLMKRCYQSDAQRCAMWLATSHHLLRSLIRLFSLLCFDILFKMI